MNWRYAVRLKNRKSSKRGSPIIGLIQRRFAYLNTVREKLDTNFGELRSEPAFFYLDINAFSFVPDFQAAVLSWLQLHLWMRMGGHDAISALRNRQLDRWIERRVSKRRINFLDTIPTIH